MPAKLAHKEHPEQKKKGSLRRVDQQDASHGVSAYGPAKDAARLTEKPGSAGCLPDSAFDARHLPLP